MSLKCSIIYIKARLKLHFSIVHLFLIWKKKERTLRKNLKNQVLIKCEVTYLTCNIYNLQVHDMILDILDCTLKLIVTKWFSTKTKLLQNNSM